MLCTVAIRLERCRRARHATDVSHHREHSAKNEQENFCLMLEMSFDLALSSDMSRSKLMNIKGIKARLLCTVIRKKNANCGLFILTVSILIVGNFQALSDFAQSFLFQFPTATETPLGQLGCYDRMGLQHTQAWDNPILYIYIVIGKGGPPDYILSFSC